MIILHVATGREFELRERLQEYAPLVPITAKLLRVGGTWKSESYGALIPGYLFLDCAVDVQDYYRIMNTTGVIRALNYNDPLPEREAQDVRVWAQAVIEPHVIDAAGNVREGIFPTGALKKMLKRQRRAVFEIMLNGRKQDVTVSAEFLG